VEATESITVPAGTFQALRIRTTVTVSGNVLGTPINETEVQVFWVAENIGLVKVTDTDSEGTTTSLLTAANVPLPSPSTPFQMSDHFPLASGNFWTFQASDAFSTFTNTLSVQSGSTPINGAVTKAVVDSVDGFVNYLTNDSSGVRVHGDADPAFGESETFSPPIVIANAQVNIGEVINGSGSVAFTVSGSGTATLSYTSTSVVEAFETVTVPAGTFPAVRIKNTVNVTGTAFGVSENSTETSTFWFARNVGLVKIVFTDSDGTTTSVLTAMNVMPVTILKSDIVIDFGSIGLWARMNDSNWLKLNNGSPSQTVVGDMDGNGADDVVAVFGTSGIFVKRNLGGWSQLHNFIPEAMAVGDLDGNGKDDIVIDFGGIGLWARMNDSSWLKLNNISPSQMVVGDMDGNGKDDVIAVFGSSGIFVKRNLGGWSQLHNFIPEAMAAGDLDGNGKDDIVIDFGGIGLWARMNDASWSKLHNSSPDLITTGDLDGNGADDVIATFSGSGLWQKINLGGWGQLNPNAPDEVAAMDVDGSGKDDIIAKFGSTIGGLFVKRNQGGWVKLHNTSPDSIAVGNLDGN